MTKAELVAAVHSNNGLYLSKNAVEEIIGPTFKSIAKNNELPRRKRTWYQRKNLLYNFAASCGELNPLCGIKKSKRFSDSDFGTFTVKKARTGRNPQTGEKLKIKPSKTVGF